VLGLLILGLLRRLVAGWSNAVIAMNLLRMPAPHSASPEPISRAPTRNVAESSPMLLASAGESVNRLEQLAALLGRDRLVTGRERVLYAVVHVVVEDLEGHHL